jgi:hypothetical protein
MIFWKHGLWYENVGMLEHEMVFLKYILPECQNRLGPVLQCVSEYKRRFKNCDDNQ